MDRIPSANQFKTSASKDRPGQPPTMANHVDIDPSLVIDLPCSFHADLDTSDTSVVVETACNVEPLGVDNVEPLGTSRICCCHGCLQSIRVVDGTVVDAIALSESIDGDSDGDDESVCSEDVPGHVDGDDEDGDRSYKFRMGIQDSQGPSVQPVPTLLVTGALAAGPLT